MIVKIIDQKTKKVIDRGLYFNRTLNHIQLGDSIGYGECFAWRKHDIREVDYEYEGERQEKWSNDLYVDTLSYAAKAHGKQQVKFRGYSYLAHIASVAQEIMALDKGEFDFDDAIQIALLHDVLEDTTISFEQLVKEIGCNVARGVLALTKNKTLDKKTQMADSLGRIKNEPIEVAMVKMADRIINLQEPPKEWSINKRLRYAKEAEVILESLSYANDELAERLERKIFEYKLWYVENIEGNISVDKEV